MAYLEQCAKQRENTNTEGKTSRAQGERALGDAGLVLWVNNKAALEHTQRANTEEGRH